MSFHRWRESFWTTWTATSTPDSTQEAFPSPGKTRYSHFWVPTPTMSPNKTCKARPLPPPAPLQLIETGCFEELNVFGPDGSRSPDLDWSQAPESPKRSLLHRIFRRHVRAKPAGSQHVCAACVLSKYLFPLFPPTAPSRYVGRKQTKLGVQRRLHEVRTAQRHLVRTAAVHKLL